VSQNTSHAVMAQRAKTAPDELDFFPTPPWATRALIEHVIIGGGWRSDNLAAMSCEEPACGQGHMARPLAEYFHTVFAADCHDYGYGDVRDFLMPGKPLRRCNWIITNPPFRLAPAFVTQALGIAKTGVAMLVRTAFLEGVGRYQSLFSQHRPLFVAPFTERVPMVKGRLDRAASSATSYCWIVWATSNDRPHFLDTHLKWIPPCRKKLERDDDYGAGA
jgi:hypothetical protein